MDTLKVHSQTITLVDQVEDKLLNYLKEKDIRTGDSIPNELELAAALGVARSVLREALSRLKMMGMIETRTRRGMILTEPTILGGMKRVVDPRILGEEALFDILGFRIALEIGICSDIFRNITPEDISELEEIIHPVMIFVKNKFKDLLEPINIEMKEQGQIVTHVDLLNFLKNRNELGYRKAIEQHFEVYKRFLNSRK